MNNITEKVWQKIESEKIQPAPQKVFILKHGFVWFLGTVVLLVSSLITAVIIFFISNFDWDIAHRFTNSKILFFFLALPYFLLILLFFFIWLFYYNYRHTKYGYRLNFWLLILIFIVLNAILGFAANYFNFGQQIENACGEKINFYNHLDTKSIIWSSVDKGLLAGKIFAIAPTQISLADLDGNVWQIKINENSKMAGISLNEKVKIIGQKIGEREFLAEEIRPWCGCGKCLQNSASCSTGPNGSFCSTGCGH